MGKWSLHDVWEWFRRTFASVKDDIAKIAVTVTENVKLAVDSPAAQIIAQALDTALKTHLAEDVLAILKIAALKALAAALALEKLPDNPTGDDILKFEEDVYTALTGKTPSELSKAWTTFAVDLKALIMPLVDAGKPLTFAQEVKLIEDAYQAYLRDIQSTQP